MEIFWKKDSVFDYDEENGILKYHYDAEEVWIQPWGANSLRVRATKMSEFPDENWALSVDVEKIAPEVDIQEGYAVIRNGRISAKITKYGKMTIYNQKGEILLDEYLRNRKDKTVDYCSALDIDAREFKPIIGGDYQLTMRFVSNPNEKIYGMGQYQQPYLNLKGTDLELAQRNSQASVPFAVSSLGYGFLWNNPAVGRVVFGKNITSWEAFSTKALDYWITAGDTPAQIEEAYASVSGTVPMMPDYAMGFWQCKLRYQTQEELLNVAREYKKRNLPISGGYKMKLTIDGISNHESWEKAGIMLPGYDVTAVSEKAKKEPQWVHFGIGNIFRIFIGGIADGLLEQGVMDRGITCVETFDYDVVDKIYEPYDNLGLSVILYGDGTRECKVLGSLAEAIKPQPCDTVQ